MAGGKFVSPTLKPVVTPDMWETAIAASSAGCLVADAIKRQYPHLSNVSVDMATIRVSDRKKGLRYTYLAPESVQNLLLALDQGWSQPDTHELTIKTAVKTSKIVNSRKRAEARAAHVAALTEKEKAGTLTTDEKRALTKLRKRPVRATKHGKTEAAKDPHNRTIHGPAPTKGPDNPNLLKGRDRQFGKKSARPALIFEEAVARAAEERADLIVAERLAAMG